MKELVRKFLKDCWPELVLTFAIALLAIAAVQVWINLIVGCK
jgi:hypothetical protein